MVECNQAHGRADRRMRASVNTKRQGIIMWDLWDVEVTVIEIDSDGDGLGDEELVIVEDTEG